ncbi:MAG: HAD family hydrolase [Candidatus Rokuibacteriota bacterium]
MICRACSGRLLSRPPGSRAITQAAILFDFGGTLDAEGVSWKERFFRLYRAEGLGISREQFDPIFYAADDALVGAIPTTLPFGDTVRRVAAGVTRRLAVAEDALTERVTTAFVDDAMAIARQNVPLLARLAERFRLGVVSNFYGNLVTVCDDVGVRPFLGVIVDSVWAGCTKPDPRIFRRAVEGLRVSPVDATFVGDSLARDMAGARALGMPHVWLAGQAGGSVCCAGDRTIRTLKELEDVLA